LFGEGVESAVALRPAGDSGPYQHALSVSPVWEEKVLVVTAKKEDLVKWEALIRRYETNGPR
jgi:hypothetical protein